MKAKPYRKDLKLVIKTQHSFLFGTELGQIQKVLLFYYQVVVVVILKCFISLGQIGFGWDRYKKIPVPPKFEVLPSYLLYFLITFVNGTDGTDKM